MAMKKRRLSAPPTEWVDCLEKQAYEVRRVRMLWRRGRGFYRPLVPLDIDLEELDSQPDSEWNRLELPETNFEWSLDPADEADPRECIEELVSELWTVARAWTRESGLCCDFQLVGLGPDGTILFEDARRCRFTTGKPAQAPSNASRPAPEPVTVMSPDYDAISDLDGRKDRFIDRLAGDRNWSFNTAQEAMTNAQRAMSAAPTVLEQVGDILQQTISYQHDVVEQLRDQSSEKADADKHAVTEQELTKRMAIRGKILTHLVDNTLSAAVPLANGILGWVTNRRTDVLPTFNKAQDAMTYLLYSLSPTRLSKVCDGSQQAAGAFLALLEDGARFQSERDAVLHIESLIMLLRDEQFERAANFEEQLAARYIIGRFALYKSEETDSARASAAN